MKYRTDYYRLLISLIVVIIVTVSIYLEAIVFNDCMSDKLY